MAGKATLTIVTSRKPMKTATAATIRTFQRRAMRPPRYSCLTQRTLPKVGCIMQPDAATLAAEEGSESASAHLRHPAVLDRPHARGDRRPLDAARDPRRVPRRAPLRGLPEEPRRGAQRAHGPSQPAGRGRHPAPPPVPGAAGAL